MKRGKKLVKKLVGELVKEKNQNSTKKIDTDISLKNPTTKMGITYDLISICNDIGII